MKPTSLETPPERRRIAFRCIDAWKPGGDDRVYSVFRQIGVLKQLLCCLSPEDKADILELMRTAIYEDSREASLWMTKIMLIQEPEQLT